MDYGKQKFQQWLMDFLQRIHLLEGLIAIIQCVLEYLEKEKRFESGHNINSKTIYKIRKLLNTARTVLSQKESTVMKFEYLASLKSLRNTFQQHSQQYKSKLTADSVVFAFVVTCTATLLTKREETISISAKENTFKGQSVKEIVKQCLSFDYANITEVIQAYPLQLPVGLVTSPNPSRRLQNHTHHASDPNVPSRSNLNSMTSEFESSGDTPQLSASNDVPSSNNELPSPSTQPHESQYNGGWSLITAASFTQPLLLHESPQSLSTEAISQSSDPFSDEEQFPGDLLPSIQQPSSSDILNCPTQQTLQHQVIASEEDTNFQIEVSPVEDDNSHATDQHLLDETVLPQPTYKLTPTEIEVKGFINNVGRQNDLKLFSAELGITDVQQESNFPDGLLDQLPVPVGQDTVSETKFSSTQAVVVEGDEKLVMVSTQNAHS